MQNPETIPKKEMGSWAPDRGFDEPGVEKIVDLPFEAPGDNLEYERISYVWFFGVSIVPCFIFLDISWALAMYHLIFDSFDAGSGNAEVSPAGW